MKAKRIPDHVRLDLKNGLNQKENLKAIGAKKNRNKGVDIKRVIKRGYKIETARERESVQTALNASQRVTEKLKTRGGRAVMRDVSEQLRKALNDKN